MITLGLDLGRRRIGVAICDLPSLGARPLTTLMRTSPARDLARLRALVAEREVRRIVLGLPLNMDGSEGPSARHARRFADNLSRELGLPVELYDERLTSFEAQSRLEGSSMNRDRRKLMVDQVAAVLILESWLAAHKDDESVRG